jgi:hypothetical protein
MSFKNLKGQTVHWIHHLQEYSFTLEHRQGWKHISANALSQQPCWKYCTHCQKVEAWADVQQVRAVAAVAIAVWNPSALRSEQPKGGNRDQTAPRMEIPHCKEWHTRVPLGICCWTINNSPDNFP